MRDFILANLRYTYGPVEQLMMDLKTIICDTMKTHEQFFISIIEDICSQKKQDVISYTIDGKHYDVYENCYVIDGITYNVKKGNPLREMVMHINAYESISNKLKKQKESVNDTREEVKQIRQRTSDLKKMFKEQENVDIINDFLGYLKVIGTDVSNLDEDDFSEYDETDISELYEDEDGDNKSFHKIYEDMCNQPASGIFSLLTKKRRYIHYLHHKYGDFNEYNKFYIVNKMFFDTRNQDADKKIFRLNDLLIKRLEYMNILKDMQDSEILNFFCHIFELTYNGSDIKHLIKKYKKLTNHSTVYSNILALLITKSQYEEVKSIHDDLCVNIKNTQNLKSIGQLTYEKGIQYIEYINSYVKDFRNITELKKEWH